MLSKENSDEKRFPSSKTPNAWRHAPPLFNIHERHAKGGGFMPFLIIAPTGQTDQNALLDLRCRGIDGPVQNVYRTTLK